MAPSVTQLLIVLAIVVLLFGAKKIPDLAKGLGSGIKNFKKAVRDDDEADSTPQAAPKEVASQTKQTSTDSTQNSDQVKNS